MKKIIARKNGAEMEIFSQVLGNEELAALSSLVEGASFSEVSSTEEEWDGKTAFIFRQNGRERRFV